MSLSVLARADGGAQAACVRLKPGGSVGEHPAAMPQLFVVVEGSGRVRAGDEKVSVEAGQAVLREAGEAHEPSAGPDGVTVAVLEAEHLLGP